MTNNEISTRVILIRHGITDWIEKKILHGISDRPLSAFGLEQAELVGKAMRNTTAMRLFVSPLKRAVQTAQSFSEDAGLKLELTDGLMEMNYGWFEGKMDYWHYLKDHKLAVNLYYVARAVVGLFSGESLGHFRKRVVGAWDSIRAQANGEPMIVVAHSGVLRTILLHEFGGDFNDASKFGLGTCSISEIEIYPHAPSKIIRINDQSHLDGKVGA